MPKQAGPSAPAFPVEEVFGAQQSLDALGRPSVYHHLGLRRIGYYAARIYPILISAKKPADTYQKLATEAITAAQALIDEVDRFLGLDAT